MLILLLIGLLAVWSIKYSYEEYHKEDFKVTYSNNEQIDQSQYIYNEMNRQMQERFIIDQERFMREEFMREQERLMMEEVMREQERFMMEESMRSVNPLESGGYDINQGNSFNHMNNGMF